MNENVDTNESERPAYILGRCLFMESHVPFRHASSTLITN